ncbi:MAG TPA: aquaporin [Bryobacteraceae bacterium]|nr:aquaporin [Bryobacteraceae bacterium]
MKKYLAEFLGTFALALAVGLSLTGKFPVPTPVIAGLTLGICVYTLGAISGTHINPAITIGLLAIGKINVKDAALYLVAQFAGGGAAYFLTAVILGSHPPVAAVDSVAVFGAEALGTFWLAVGVGSVVLGKAPAAAAGLTIGGSLLLGISFAAPISNGVLNPAVALGIGSFSLMYVLGPIVGAAVAMLLYKFTASE